jgi:signal transduction histidine kinase/CheY-like chemotaxis protein/HPt (histidine-containing phosphotransfer) domain-containing protein/PAS domain-containing protein
MPAVRSFALKKPASRSLYLQLLFVTLAFTLMVVSSRIFVNKMLVNYLENNVEDILTRTQIRIVNELREPEVLMISIVKNVRDIIMAGGGADDVLEYYNEITADLFNKKEGFVFDGLHGYFEAFGNVYIPVPGWIVPDDYDATNRPWYKAAVEADGKIAILPIYRNLRTGEHQINFACRIFNDAGVPLGVVSMNMPFNNITQFVADMQLVEGGYGFLADENFELIVHHEADFVTMHMNEISPAARQIVRMMEQGESYIRVESDNYQGIRSIIYCKRIDNGWYLGIITPRNVYYRDLRILTLSLVILGFVLMLAVDIILVRIDAARNKLDEAFKEQRVQLALANEMRVLDERVRLMLDTAPFGATLFDKEYNVVDCNQAILLILGAAGNKDKYKNNFFEFSPEYQPNGVRTENLLREYINMAFENHGGPFPWTHKNINGELIPCEVTLVHSTYMGQEVIIGYARDIREELKVQEKTREAQAAITQMQRTIEEKNALSYLSNVLDGLDTMIYVADPDTSEILFINDNLKRHYGIEGDATGQICYKIFQKDLNEKCVFCPCFQLDKEPDKVIVWEERSAFKDCVYRNIDRYIDWPNGKKAHLQQSIDITDLRIMTDTLNKRFEQQSLMTYITQSFLSTEDIDMLMTRVLRMVGEFMGFDQILMHVTQDDETSFICRNEYINPKLGFPTRVGGDFKINKAVWDIIQRVKEQEIVYATSNDPDVREAISPYRVNFLDYILTCVFLGDKLYAVIDFSRGGDGGYLWDHDEIYMASYVTNVLVGALNKRSIELQLIAAKESAEQSNRSKGVFLAHMSHEIRTPMNAILGISEIQLRNKTISPDAEEAFKQIYDSGNLLLNIINDILDLSKVEAGKLEIVPVMYNIPSLINGAAQLNRLRYESKPIEFIINVDENTPLKLLGDELRIKQILNNLLSNAFKYTGKGKIELSAYAEHGKNKETVTLVFRVSDTGQGMREDQIDRLFDEYSRFNMQTNRGISGTGLGMSIVKRLIDMMDGQISVESEVGKGTAFTVRLPQENVGSAVCGAELADSLRNFRFYSMSISKKAQIVCEYMPYGSVLIVDDVASNLYVAKGLLTPYGLRIETAASGTEVIEKIKNGSEYDIVFMDHMMPVVDGLEAVKIIRDMGYTRPVIALTANAVVGQSDVFLANGFDGFISKPIDSRELDAALKSFIRDQQPREVIEATRREQREKETGNPPDPAKNKNYISEIEKFFVLDGENTIEVLEEVSAKLRASDSADMDSYITTVHGIKSALANIGETELSTVALRLEQAGDARDFTVITEETPAFIDALRFLIDKLKPSGDDETGEISGDDTVFLRDKLLEIKTACGTFDVTAAKDALESLRKKTWPRHISGVLDEISVHLLHSAFTKAAAVAENAVKM